MARLSVLWLILAAVAVPALSVAQPATQPVELFDRPAAAANIKVTCDRWPDGSSLRQFAADAIRLSDARTDKDKALAVLRWMRRWTMFTNSTAPSERGQSILDDLKILNVYGAHWCDGRALLMENLWRSVGGRSYKLYIPDGYTLAMIHWTDDDGVARWHQVHASRGWYLYDRPGKLIATPDQIGADLSLMFRPSVTGLPRSGHPPRPWNWLAVGHRDFSRHDTTLDLRPGESYVRQWGHEGVPACNNVGAEQYDDAEHGPYSVTYGNGRFVSTIDPVAHRAAVKTVGDRCELVWPVRLPHVIADAWIERGAVPADLKVSLGFDGQNYWDATESDKQKFELGLRAKGDKSLVGRYRFLLKLSWPAAQNWIAPLTLTTIVQHNLFSLPQLSPGRNVITVSGDLPAGTELLVRYQWADAAGKQDKAERVARTPHSFEIAAAGKEWSDVRCTYLTIEAGGSGFQPPSRRVKDSPWRGAAVFAGRSDAIIKVRAPAASMDRIVGDTTPSPLKMTAEYLAGLKDAAKRVAALDGLMVLRDPSAGPALTELLYSAEDMPLEVRGRIVQAIYWSLDRKAAFDILLPVVARDPKVNWAGQTTTSSDREGGSRSGEGWGSISSLIAHLAGLADYQPAVPTLIDGFNRGVGRFNRPAYMRAFGRLKAKAAVPLCVRNLREHSDISAPAAEALGLIGDKSAAPELVKAVNARIDTKTHQAILYAEAATALGRLEARSSEAIKLLERLAAHDDEEVRAAAAEALGRVGEERHAHMLRFAATKEPFPWVKQVMTQSANGLDK